MRVITDAKTKTLQTKAACSFIYEQKKPLKLFSLKKTKTKTDRKEDRGIPLSDKESPD